MPARRKPAAAAATPLMRATLGTGTGLWGARRLVFDTLPSTNTWARDNLPACQHGDVIRAMTQTAGHGRLGRPWSASAGLSLAVSIVGGSK